MAPIFGVSMYDVMLGPSPASRSSGWYMCVVPCRAPTVVQTITGWAPVVGLWWPQRFGGWLGLSHAPRPAFDQLAFLLTTWAPGPHRCAQHSSTHSILHICWCAVGLWRLARRRLMLNLQLSPSGSSARGLASSISPASSWSRRGCPQGRADALGGSSTYPMTVVGRALVPVPRHPVVCPHSPSAFHRCSASAAGPQAQGLRKSPATAIAIERPHASANGQRLPRPRQRLVQQAWRDAPPFAGVGWSLMSASQRMCLTS